ncbi:MAG: hypothetical protein EPN51_25330 [Mycobacterium sp.]|nr:MAG: hypothetical protein EPN51_25330 [Mycobacterium sp.]
MRARPAAPGSAALAIASTHTRATRRARLRRARDRFYTHPRDPPRPAPPRLRSLLHSRAWDRRRLSFK